MSQKEVGEIVGVTRQTINALENSRYNPSLLVAYRITKVLKEEYIENVFQFDEDE